MLNDSVRRDRSVLPIGAQEALADDADSLGRIDLLTAGYPCQPFSTAARGRNNAADLWPEALRIIQRCRPRWIIVENVPGRRLEHVERSCRDLERCDYAVWPLDIAAEIRNHVRRRIWVVAHDNRQGEPQLPEYAEMAGLCAATGHGRRRPEPMGVDDGLPRRMDRMRALGNAIEPVIAEMLIRAVLEDSGDLDP